MRDTTCFVSPAATTGDLDWAPRPNPFPVGGFWSDRSRFG